MNEKTRHRPDTGDQQGKLRVPVGGRRLRAVGPSELPAARAFLHPVGSRPWSRRRGRAALPVPLPFLRLVAPHPRAGTCRPPGRGGPAHSASLGRRCPSDDSTRRLENVSPHGARSQAPIGQVDCGLVRGAWPGRAGGSAPTEGTSAGSPVPREREFVLKACVTESGFWEAALARAGGWTGRTKPLGAAWSGGSQSSPEERPRVPTPAGVWTGEQRV